MFDPFDLEKERIHITDNDGSSLEFRPVAVISFDEMMYCVFGCLQTLDDGQTRQMRLLLTRREEEKDGESRFALCDDENEVSQIVGTYLRQAIGSIARMATGNADDEEMAECDEDHAFSDFCYCAQPEYLQ